jgi:hypothetical protein
MKLVLIYFTICTVVFWSGQLHSEETIQEDVDLTLINEPLYDLSKPLFSVRPTLGYGLRDMQNSAGGSACTSCAH